MNIAKTEFLMITPQGDRRKVTLTIGKPYKTKGHGACPVGMKGLYPKVRDICGDDTWQALALAIQFVRSTLTFWRKKGFRFASPDGHPFNPDRLWFSDPTSPINKKRTIPNNARISRLP